MPKKARFVRTNSVKGGPRSSGGGTRNNGPNCMVLVVLGALLLAGGCAGAIGQTAILLGLVLLAAGVYAVASVWPGRRRGRHRR